jgi:hypothetical protein
MFKLSRFYLPIPVSLTHQGPDFQDYFIGIEVILLTS